MEHPIRWYMRCSRRARTRRSDPVPAMLSVDRVRTPDLHLTAPANGDGSIARLSAPYTDVYAALTIVQWSWTAPADRVATLGRSGRRPIPPDTPADRSTSLSLTQ